MNRVAAMVDANNLVWCIRDHWKHDKSEYPAPGSMVKLIRDCLSEEEELFRIYYYDAYPLAEKTETAITKKHHDFEQTTIYKSRKRFLDRIKIKNFIAFRAGHARFRGWVLRQGVLEDIRTGKRDVAKSPLTDDDFKPNIEQKGVDIKLGLDMAWLASKGIVNKILVFSSDTDLVPAMKFAREHGLTVVAAKMPATTYVIGEHADEVRHIKWNDLCKDMKTI